MAVGHLSDDALLLAVSFAIREDTPFAFSINKKPPQTYSDFLDRARHYINAETLTSKKSGAVKTSRGNSKEDRRKEKKRLAETPVGGSHQSRDDKKHRDSHLGNEAARAHKQRYGMYHELTASIEEIFVNSRSEVDFRPSLPKKGNVLEKHKDKFCLIHNTPGHTTVNCFDLKDEREFLIRKGKLAGYRKDADRGAKISPNGRIECEIH